MTRLGLAFFGLFFTASAASAQTPACDPNHTLDRAGHPERTAWYAHSSDTGRYVGYYVGGGIPCNFTGQDRHPWEGTWGWDYRGFCLPSRIALDWYHGGRYQGGQGAYRTDGPRPLEHAKER